MKTRLLCLLVAQLCSANSHSGELNERTHLNAPAQAKVNALLANAYAQGNTATDKKTVASGIQAGSGQQVDIGSSHSTGNAPREQNTVVNGDVTVICHHCYGR